ncbi:MAG: hypothetical protein BIFFINMI_02074 [Phycisphaerae bacterium]|nr:hypothetical protein [Phycisphaerae bacterium]
MNRRKLLQRIANGNLKNIRFADLVALVEGFGFVFDRQAGSHRLFVHPGVDELLNLQPEGKDAKPYQVRQLLQLVEDYNLELKD